MFTKYIGWIFILVLIATFLPMILEVIGWLLAAILGGIVVLMLLGVLYRRLRPRRETRVYHIYTRR